MMNKDKLEIMKALIDKKPFMSKEALASEVEFWYNNLKDDTQGMGESPLPGSQQLLNEGKKPYFTDGERYRDSSTKKEYPHEW